MSNLPHTAAPRHDQAPLPPPVTAAPGRRRREVVRRPLRRIALRRVALRTHLVLAGHFGHNYVKKYYMDTFLGILWIPLRPLAEVFLRSLLFGSFLQVSAGGRPYLLFLVIGSIGWFFFERATYWGYRSLQYNYRYFRAVPVPWLPAITGAAVPAAVQAVVYFLIGIAAAVYYWYTDNVFGLTFGPGTLYAVLGLALLLLCAWVLGLFLGPLVRVARDVRLLIPYPMMLVYILTPIVYTIDTMPPKYRDIAIYNPLTAPIELIRHGLLGMPMPATASIATTVVVIAVTLPVALLVFAHAEKASHVRL